MDLPYRRLIAAAFGSAALLLAADEGKIMRPADGAVYRDGAVDVVARAPAGRLELDGVAVEAEEPFPDVFHGQLEAAPGEHVLALVWEGGRKEVRFFVGEDAPEGFQPFRPHPPLAGVECASCHSLSRRGRFRFSGDCFTCHAQEQYDAKHPHPAHILERCGDCHNAHGSTAAAHMIHPRETACRLCHSL